MNRRELIKAILPIAAAPIVVKGVEVGKKYEIDPEKKYIVFVNERLVDPEVFARYEISLPPGTVIHSVHHDIDDAIRIYKVY